MHLPVKFLHPWWACAANHRNCRWEAECCRNGVLPQKKNSNCSPKTIHWNKLGEGLSIRLMAFLTHDSTPKVKCQLKLIQKGGSLLMILKFAHKRGLISVRIQPALSLTRSHNCPAKLESKVWIQTRHLPFWVAASSTGKLENWANKMLIKDQLSFERIQFFKNFLKFETFKLKNKDSSHFALNKINFFFNFYLFRWILVFSFSEARPPYYGDSGSSERRLQSRCWVRDFKESIKTNFLMKIFEDPLFSWWKSLFGLTSNEKLLLDLKFYRISKNDIVSILRHPALSLFKESPSIRF